ncbi:hypothetical protein KORDIASMS9_02696 [Kordia sp. SMS9]|uniref:hypothetical protein n=1 Tax=Kordia sp. SMS9 TaxID=2282170 RepID=UPI000E0DC19D|nr:hypothetical protein [Kordia sp. SMS9]AXG70456.1 hypothetical protein KORDIASMS9_02696 [Kordia sp. SMS9]
MIEMKLNIEKLLLISKVFNLEFESNKNLELPRDKADLSLAKSVYKKLGKKILERIDKPKDKEFKISFKYHEAYIVQQTISKNLWNFINHPFEASVLRSQNDDLQQKLTTNV